MFSFAAFGNDLYSGKRSIAFMPRRRLWYTIAITMSVLSILALVFIRLNPGIEFRGGSEFQVANIRTTSEGLASSAVDSVVPGTDPQVTVVGNGQSKSMRVQTDSLTSDQTDKVAAALASAYQVSPSDVTSSFVGASWGSDVTKKAVQGLLIFLVLVAGVIAAYFRTWKMSVAALIALLHDLLITAGVYALTGFEVTPASVIGFLTILGYSLYDTVVVFDKVRENTDRITTSTRRTYEEAANLAVNQTLVRSINTSIVALLPVASILFIGAFILGAGTLKDISLALFVGIAAGTYSSIFIATPLLVDLRRREPEIMAHTRKLLKRRADSGQAVPVPGSSSDYGSYTEDAAAPGRSPVTAGIGSGRGSNGAGAGASPMDAPASTPTRERSLGTQATRRADSGQRAQPKRGKRR